ncbi:hypothetical protein GCM10009864_75710 [Streptomyces lunalinharesii]|uniref:Transposase n=1 Tax=Streptomyces lunalinharesii TaxID=333384 RepID=A0ABP6FFB4_9ACTN
MARRIPAATHHQADTRIAEIVNTVAASAIAAAKASLNMHRVNRNGFRARQVDMRIQSLSALFADIGGRKSAS